MHRGGIDDRGPLAASLQPHRVPRDVPATQGMADSGDVEAQSGGIEAAPKEDVGDPEPAEPPHPPLPGQPAAPNSSVCGAGSGRGARLLIHEEEERRRPSAPHKDVGEDAFRRRKFVSADAAKQQERCPLCREPGHTKERCRFYVPAENSQRARGVSSELSYTSSRATAQVMANTSLMGGRSARERRTRSKTSSKDVRRHVCYLCGQMGHWKLDCPQNPTASQHHLVGTPAAAAATESDKANLWARGQDDANAAGKEKRLADIRTDAAVFNKPLPTNVDITIPGIAKAWEWFQRVDVDGSGQLDQEEVKELAKQLGLKWTKKELSRVYERMTTVNGYYTAHSSSDDSTSSYNAPSNGKGASFQDFASWWARHTALQRRNMRRTVKELFDNQDKEKTGILTQAEVERLVRSVEADSSLPGMIEDEDEELTPQSAWDEMTKGT